MRQEIQEIDNAREENQREIMQELAVTGECFLCADTIKRISEKYPGVSTSAIHEGEHWYVKQNDFPYKGTKLHLLIVPKRHLSGLEQLTVEEFAELQKMVAFVNNKYEVTGAVMFLRYGKMSFTAATLSHLHFQLMHGVEKYEGCNSIKVKLGYA